MRTKEILITVWILGLGLSLLRGQGCAAPQNLKLRAGLAQASLSWDTVAGALSYEVAYRPAGSGTYQMLNVGDTGRYTISGLQGRKYYQVRVRSVCGGSFSSWLGPSSALVHCNSQNSPWREDFEGSIWSGVPFGSSPNCWQMDNSIFSLLDAGFPFANQNKHISMGPSYNPGNRATFETPLIDLSSLSQPEWGFNIRANSSGASGAILIAEVSADTGQSWQTLRRQNLDSTLGKGQYWSRLKEDLSSYQAQTIMLRLRQPGFNNSKYYETDNWTVGEATCPPLRGIHALSTQTTRLGWAGFSSDTVQYKLRSMSSPNSWVQQGSISEDTLWVQNLLPDQIYQLFVRQPCDTLGGWMGPYEASTDCSVFTAPYFNDFEDTTAPTGIPVPCWRSGLVNAPGLEGDWQQIDRHTLVRPVFPAFPIGGYFMHLYRQNATRSSDQYLKSPWIALDSLQSPSLSFRSYPMGMPTLKMVVRLNDGQGWHNLDTITGPVRLGTTKPWNFHRYDLSAYRNDTVRVSFVAQWPSGGSQGSLSIDGFAVEEAPACQRPSRMEVEAVTPSAVYLRWKPGDSARATQVSYGAYFLSDPDSGTIATFYGDSGAVRGNFQTGVPLVLYYRDSCYSGAVSPWQGPIQIDIPCAYTTIPRGWHFDSLPSVIYNYSRWDITDSTCWSRNFSPQYFQPVNFSQNNLWIPPSDINNPGNAFLINRPVSYFIPNMYSGLSTELRSPYLDLSQATRPTLSWRMVMTPLILDKLQLWVEEKGRRYPLQTFDFNQGGTPFYRKWQRYRADLSAYTGDSIRVIFEWDLTTLPNQEMGLDDIHFKMGSTCSRPQDLRKDSIGPHQIQLSWRPVSNPVVIRYREQSVPRGNWQYDTLPAQQGNILLTALKRGAYYEIQLRGSCTVASSWTQVYRVQTSCGSYQLPYFQDFEALGRLNGPGSSPYKIGWCGSSDNLFGSPRTHAWGLLQPSAMPRTSGPSYDRTFREDTGYVLTMIPSPLQYPITPTTWTIESPMLDLAGSLQPQLKFWLHRYGDQIENLEVGLKVGDRYTVLDTFAGASQRNGLEPWEKVQMDLSAYRDSLVQVFWRYQVSTQGNKNFRVSIDDFEVRETPSCREEDSITVQVLNADSAQVQWHPASQAGNFIAYYRPLFSDQPYQTATSSSPTVLISGLDASSSYQVYLRRICAGNDSSKVSAMRHFSTDCGLVEAPYLETFDGLPWLAPTGYNVRADQISPCWQRPASFNQQLSVGAGETYLSLSGPSRDWSGNGQYLFLDSRRNSAYGQISSPRIYLPSGLNNPYLKWAAHRRGPGVGEMKIEVKTDTGGWKKLWQVNGPSQQPVWQQDSVSLGYWTQQNIQLRLSARADSLLGDAAFDQLEVYNAPQPCLTPVADFDYTANYFKVDFDPSPSQYEDDYEWQMNGARYYNRYPQYTFPAPGRYPVILKAENNCGVYDTIKKYITICDTLEPRFGHRYAGDTLILDASHTEGATGYSWDLDAGKQDTGAVVRVTYGDLQAKRIVLTAYNACDTLEITRFVDPCPQPQARALFQAGPPPANGGLRVDFDGRNSLYAESYWWDFGDGDTARGPTPSHVYATPSLNHTVRLVVGSWCGFQDTLIRPLDQIGLESQSWRDRISVYPNPTRGTLLVHWPENLDITALSLYDARGNHLKDYYTRAKDRQSTLSLKELPAGTYHLRVKGADRLASFRVVLIP